MCCVVGLRDVVSGVLYYGLVGCNQCYGLVGCNQCYGLVGCNQCAVLWVGWV